jgi:thioredoxin 1
MARFGVHVATDHILALNEDNFDDAIGNGAQPILVDFWASWCQPCKVIVPSLEQIAVELDGRASVGHVNVDENGDLADRFGVRSIPTLVVFKDGKVIDRMIGAHSKEQIRDLIGKHLDT